MLKTILDARKLKKKKTMDIQDSLITSQNEKNKD